MNSLRATIAGAAFALAVGVVTPAVAQDQVTVVQRNGDSVSGRMEDLANGLVYVRVSLHDQRRIRLEDIAVMQTVAGPLPRDLRGRGQALVLTDGSVLRGRLLNIEGGEGSAKPDEPRVISFSTQGGERRFRWNEVRAVVLDPSAVGPRPTPPSERPSGWDGDVFVVRADQPWSSTGISVRKGDRVAFRASGEVVLSADGGDVAGPDGSSRGRYAPGSPMPRTLAGALIGRIGNGRPFGIGTQTTFLQMPQDGVLSLGINDDGFGDNRGEFRVRIQLPR